MYDRNGLELTPKSDSRNTYKGTAANMKGKFWYSTARSNDKTKMGGHISWHTFGRFQDPRDAAYAAQEFAKIYNKEAVDSLVESGEFYETAKAFVANLDFPEWKFPAEGLSIDEMLGEPLYKFNRVNDARDALVEAIKVFDLKAPDLKTAARLLGEVESLYNQGYTYREAAKMIMMETV
jgi:hypothetical protein